MKRNLTSVRQFVADNPIFSEQSIRWQIFNANSNGLAESRAIIRLGRRVLIDVDRYNSWLDLHVVKPDSIRLAA